MGLVFEEEAVRRQVQDARRAGLLEPALQGVRPQPGLDTQERGNLLARRAGAAPKRSTSRPQPR
jgi:hypothetical protein